MRSFFPSRGMLCVVAFVCATASGQTPAERPGYVIGPNDQLEIEVLEDDSLDTETRVSEQGTIELPHVGEISVSGLTAPEAAAAITQLLGKYLQRATVTVRITDYRSRPITVIGAVKKPGRLPFTGRWTLLDALTEAGGPSGEAGSTVIVLRQADNGLSDKLTVELEDLYLDLDPDVNVPIFANDVINVPEASQITIHIIGEVGARGSQSFSSTESVTLVTAIARAGGPTDNASGKVTVRRGGELIPLNFKKILAGEKPDFLLQDGDVLIVKEAFF